VIRGNVAQGIYAFFITDDNFGAHKDWGGVAHPYHRTSREGGLGAQLHYPGRHALPQAAEFHREVRKAGVRTMFHGLEKYQSGQSARLAKKRQNKITDYREMMLAWEAGQDHDRWRYILGFPNDTPASIVRDIKIIQDELPIDMLEFFFLTAAARFGGSQTLYTNGVAMDSDLNNTS